MFRRSGRGVGRCQALRIVSSKLGSILPIHAPPPRFRPQGGPNHDFVNQIVDASAWDMPLRPLPEAPSDSGTAFGHRFWGDSALEMAVSTLNPTNPRDSARFCAFLTLSPTPQCAPPTHTALAHCQNGYFSMIP